MPLACPSHPKDSQLLHHLDLARIIYFDVRSLLLADYHPTNSNGFAAEVGGRVVNARLAEFRPSNLGDDHTQVFRITMVRLGVKEDLARAGATLRLLDEHFHRDRLVDPAVGV